MGYIKPIGPKKEGVLYHYTSQASLFNIVTNRSVWASHVSYMNDANEIRYAANQAKLIIDNAVTYSENEEKLLRQLSTWLDQYIRSNHFIFSFSLSENGNLLSQWRAYTPKEAGVSIGFNKDDLEKHCEKYDLQLVQCIYEPKQQEELLLKAINYVLEQFDLNHESIHNNLGPETQEYYPFLNPFTEFFLYEFAKIKDPLFSEEREWRLLSKYYNNYTHTDIKFRAGKTTLIPYVEFSLKGIRHDGKLFEQVYVGPSSNFNLSFSAVSAFLSNQGAGTLTINSMQTIREV